MTNEFMPPRLRAAKGMGLVERDTLAEIHAQDREGGCPDDAEGLSKALCGVKAQHVGAAIAKLRGARLVEVVLDANENRLLRTTELSEAYWVPVEEPLYPGTGGTPCGSKSPSDTLTTEPESAQANAPSPLPSRTPTMHSPTSSVKDIGISGMASVENGSNERPAGECVSSSTNSTPATECDPSLSPSEVSLNDRLMSDCDSACIEGNLHSRAHTDDYPPYNGLDLDLPTEAANGTGEKAFALSSPADKVEGVLDGEDAPALDSSEPALPCPVRADAFAVDLPPKGTAKALDLFQEVPGSEACPPKGGDREPPYLAAGSEKTREEWAEGIHDAGTYHPRARDGPAAIRDPKGGLALAIVAERQGGYVVPEDLFKKLPAEVVLSISRGEPCIPLSANKKPLVRWKEYQERMPTITDLRWWLVQFGEEIAGWARVTGRISGLIVLDDDGGGWFGRFKISPHVLTGGGGFHWIGEYPGWRVRTQNSRSSRELGAAFPQLDIRADGGYSVIAGFSVKGGYTWLREAKPDPLDLLPQYVRRFFGLEHAPRVGAKLQAHTPDNSGRPTPRPSAAILITKAAQIAASFGRENAGFWLATQARDNGYSQSESEGLYPGYSAQVGGTNTRGDVEPYSEAEWVNSVRSAYTQTARSPWPMSKKGTK